MLSGHLSIKKSNRDEAEKPFWISYADLMTALMVLFLVVMIVSMISITKVTKPTDELEKERQEDIQKILDDIKEVSPADVVIDRKDFRINLGSKAHFENGKWGIDGDSANFLRTYVPELLKATSSPTGKKWFKRFVVEGYTSPTGDYLLNLDLSLKRSESVICTLFSKDEGGQTLPLENLNNIRDLFMVGGYAFNSAKDTDYDSRRIELRLEFWELKEVRKQKVNPSSDNFGECRMK